MRSLHSVQVRTNLKESHIISEISEALLFCDDFADFLTLLDEHEEVMQFVLQEERVQTARFRSSTAWLNHSVPGVAISSWPDRICLQPTCTNGSKSKATKRYCPLHRYGPDGKTERGNKPEFGITATAYCQFANPDSDRDGLNLSSYLSPDTPYRKLTVLSAKYCRAFTRSPDRSH